MPITEAQARRALRHADIPWDSEVDDPRESPWVVHDHLGLLGGLAAAFASGRRNLRQVEDFLADLGLGARRALGLAARLPATPRCTASSRSRPPPASRRRSSRR